MAAFPQFLGYLPRPLPHLTVPGRCCASAELYAALCASPVASLVASHVSPLVTSLIACPLLLPAPLHVLLQVQLGLSRDVSPHVTLQDASEEELRDKLEAAHGQLQELMEQAAEDKKRA